MFKKTFEKLCIIKGVSPSAVCRDIGLSNATYSCWTDESIPRRATLLKLADYFGVPVEYFTEEGEQLIQNELSPEKRMFIQKVEHMSDEELKKLKQILELIESKRE